MQIRAQTSAHVALDDTPTIVATLISLSRSCRQMMQIKLAAIDVAVGQDQFLDALTAEKSIPVSLLGQMLSVRPSTVSKMADRLAAHGWVVREGDNKDMRRTRLRLTSAGLKVQVQVRDVWARLDDELTCSLRVKDEKEDMAGALERIATVLSGRLGRLR